MIKWIQALSVSIVSIFAPIESLLITTFAMIVVDLVTGLIAAYKQKEPITSSGLRRTVSKLFVYEMALLVGYLAEHYLLAESMPITKMVSGMIGLVELKSIFENLNRISGQDLLKSVLQGINSDNLPKE